MCFINGLKRGDIVIALESLNSIIRNIVEKGTTIAVTKLICIDVINMVVKVIYELDMDIFLDDIESLTEFLSLDDFKGRLEKLIGDICNYINKSREDKNIVFRDEILNYINKEFGDSSLSLEGLADRFGLSIYYISRFFKEHTGRNFIDHISRIRMEEAKRMLFETNMTLKDIVIAVGYLDIPSFSRKFKRNEGITPGQYREMHSKKASAFH